MTQNQENTPSLKHPNKRLDLIAYLEEMLLMNEKSQDFEKLIAERDKGQIRCRAR